MPKTAASLQPRRAASDNYVVWLGSILNTSHNRTFRPVARRECRYSCRSREIRGVVICHSADPVRQIVSGTSSKESRVLQAIAEEIAFLFPNHSVAPFLRSDSGTPAGRGF